MFEVKYSNLAKEDMEKIVMYIGKNLKNKKAANDIRNEFEAQVNTILKFPYIASIYMPGLFEFQYRKISVKNFSIFYVIAEETKTIIISRVLYSKRDIDKLL